MTDLSKALREQLAATAVIRTVEKDLEQRSVDGTIKYRFKTHDGRLIESVYMPSPERKTRAERFRQILEAADVVALIRANRGRDIAAACGQLANVDTRGGATR